MRRPTNAIVSSEMGKVSTGGSIDAVQQSEIQRLGASSSRDWSTGDERQNFSRYRRTRAVKYLNQINQNRRWRREVHESLQPLSFKPSSLRV